MLLDEQPLDSIEEGHLQTLVDDKVPEGKRIEYKSGGPATTDGEKKKFLIQVSSFANANGGFLLYGVEAPHGVPVALPGCEASDPDGEKQRIQNVIRDGTDPRICGINIKMVRLSTGRWVPILHIPQSFNPPHMVTLGGEHRFYSRGPAGKYRLDVDELRTIFGLSETVARRIRDFRAERLVMIRNGETPVPLLKGIKWVLHMVPFDSFAPGKTYDLGRFARDPETLPNICWKAYDGRYNFDGWVSHAGYLRPEDPEPVYSYTQCFRSGILEAVHMPYNPKVKGSVDEHLSVGYEGVLVKSIAEFLNIQGDIGVTFPLFVLLTFVDVKGVVLVGEGQPGDVIRGSSAFVQDNLILPEVVLEDSRCDIEARMRAVFDIVRNTVGLAPKTAGDES